MTAVTTVTTPGETTALCASVGVARASFYRRQRAATSAAGAGGPAAGLGTQ